SAGSVSLIGGAAPHAQVITRGADITGAVAHDFRLTSGTGFGSSVLLSSGHNIGLTIGGTLRLDGNGADAPAQIMTDARNGTISLFFPNAHSGSFFVDGVEGGTKHGQD